MYEMRSTTSGPETTLTDIIYLGGVVQELEIGVRNGSAETLKVIPSAHLLALAAADRIRTFKNQS